MNRIGRAMIAGSTLLLLAAASPPQAPAYDALLEGGTL